MYIRRDAEQPPQAVVALEGKKPGGQALVDGSEEEQHQRAPGIDVPERHRPVQLAPGPELVRGPVAVTVVLLPGADDDVGGRLRDPRLEPLADVGAFSRQPSNLLPQPCIGDDHKRLPLREPRAGPPPPHRNDPLENLSRHRLRVFL